MDYSVPLGLNQASYLFRQRFVSCRHHVTTRVSFTPPSMESLKILHDFVFFFLNEKIPTKRTNRVIKTECKSHVCVSLPVCLWLKFYELPETPAAAVK